VKGFPNSGFFILPVTDGLIELKLTIAKIEPGMIMPHGFSPDKTKSQSGLSLKNCK